jgi:hypothetical protein
MPARFAFPFSSAAAARSDAFSAFVPADLDLDLDLGFAPQSMDVDSSVFARPPTPLRKLEFADVEGVSEALGLGGLDISFDASPAEDGKIRVRIHNPATASASPSSPSSSSIAAPSPLAWPSDPLGPFLGVAAPHEDDMEMAIGSPFEHHPFAFDAGADAGGSAGFDGIGLAMGVGAAGGAGKSKRRVRIALKSMPRPGGEGGEWEVQVC